MKIYYKIYNFVINLYKNRLMKKSEKTHAKIISK